MGKGKRLKAERKKKQAGGNGQSPPGQGSLPDGPFPDGLPEPYMTGDAWHEWLMNAPPSETEEMKKAFAEGGYNAVDAFFRPKGARAETQVLESGERVYRF